MLFSTVRQGKNRVALEDVADLAIYVAVLDLVIVDAHGPIRALEEPGHHI